MKRLVSYISFPLLLIAGVVFVAFSALYVYFDDMSVFYPPGVQLSLGGLDLWANAEPIMPPISTSINANDIWAVALPGSFIAGQAGKILDVIDKTTKGNQGLILSK